CSQKQRALASGTSRACGILSRQIPQSQREQDHRHIGKGFMADRPQSPPTIELDGVRLRPLRVADADALFAYLRDSVVTELTSYPVASLPMVKAMIERC